MPNTDSVDSLEKAEPTQVISTRIPTKLLERLRKKHPNKGDTGKLLKILVERYLDGRVLGVTIQ